MALRHRLLTLVLVAGSTLVPVLGTASSSSAAEGCYPNGYGAKYKITSSRRDPVVTHAKTIYLPPGGTFNKSTTLSQVGSVTAGITVEAGASAKAGVVLAKAETHVKVALQASGTSTKTSSITESWSITNNESKKRKFVFFHGTVKHSGSFVKKTCNYSTYMVEKDFGRWKSWTIDNEGFVRCDLNYGGIAAQAKRFC